MAHELASDRRSANSGLSSSRWAWDDQKKRLMGRDGGDGLRPRRIGLRSAEPRPGLVAHAVEDDGVEPLRPLRGGGQDDRRGAESVPQLRADGAGEVGRIEDVREPFGDLLDGRHPLGEDAAILGCRCPRSCRIRGLRHRTDLPSSALRV